MKRLAIHRSSKNPDPGCTDAITMAEQELTAFFRAVTALFGIEQAELTADDWLDELSATKGLPASMLEWRRITLKVSTRLASRVKALSLAGTSQAIA